MLNTTCTQNQLLNAKVDIPGPTMRHRRTPYTALLNRSIGLYHNAIQGPIHGRGLAGSPWQIRGFEFTGQLLFFGSPPSCCKSLPPVFWWDCFPPLTKYICNLCKVGRKSNNQKSAQLRPPAPPAMMGRTSLPWDESSFQVGDMAQPEEPLRKRRHLRHLQLLPTRNNATKKINGGAAPHAK